MTLSHTYYVTLRADARSTFQLRLTRAFAGHHTPLSRLLFI
jgi:hypothetical protein